MAEPEFYARVSARAGMPMETARALTEATLRTLAERISGGEADDLSAHVAHELRPLLARARVEDPEVFGYDEFLRRIAERAGVSPADAERGARAVVQALHRVIGPVAFHRALSQLPARIGELVQPAPRG
ncbi:MULTISPECIES: DUF2267 domain-containing protein [unclassified Micromonospora]|uniref:DUF2267 domain-containing protein n=1 Tax=unclassified Micromonospora TaxID=2617518 RepID=UPI001C231E2E|nr:MULTISPECIES: DUF2267 domain-containing protein [unclassified Micromonospora]MBU8861053.1 DUF2267 domain-containing protein [Micromonospora sp. WMMB482]MDM4780597.1 DUF2267 domain-containing protein [Micromonospora sp. b486]